MRVIDKPMQRDEEDAFSGSEAPEYFAIMGAWLRTTLATNNDSE